MKKLQSEQKNLSIEQIEDLKLAAAKMSGAKRREFAVEMTNKYCQGSARKAERVFGWKRTIRSTMAVILNRMGYRLRPVVKAKPQKKLRLQMPFSLTSNTKVVLEHLESKDSA